MLLSACSFSLFMSSPSVACPCCLWLHVELVVSIPFSMDSIQGKPCPAICLNQLLLTLLSSYSCMGREGFPGILGDLWLMLLWKTLCSLFSAPAQLSCLFLQICNGKGPAGSSHRCVQFWFLLERAGSKLHLETLGCFFLSLFLPSWELDTEGLWALFPSPGYD